MKRLALAGIIGFSLIGVANAADLTVPGLHRTPPPAPAVVPAPVLNWTGCYVGAGFGYGMWTQDTTASDLDGTPTSVTQTGGGEGWFGTAQLGCDYQLATTFLGSSVVVGAFVDWDFGDLKGHPHFSIDFASDESQKWGWAFGGRVGLVAFPQLLTYFSFGFTQAHFDQVTLLDEFGGGAFGSLPAHTYNGYFLGSGYEYAVPWLQGLFWKTEYRYASYSAADLTETIFSGPDPQIIHSKKHIQSIRSELVWRFNWGKGKTPVVAKY